MQIYTRRTRHCKCLTTVATAFMTLYLTEHFNMDNTDQKLTTTHSAVDKNIDSSDLLSMLNVIKQLYDVSRIVLNSHSAAAILVSLAVEVQTLLTKLRAMRKRWEVHLPFKEASTVDFVNWSKWAGQLATTIASSDCRTCLNPSAAVPSSHSLLDLYHEAAQALAENTDTVDLTDPRELLQHHASMQTALNSQREKCMETISQMISGQFAESQEIKITAFCDLTAVRNCCSDLLMQLAEELDLLHEQQVKIFSPKDYERLADRILYESEYEGQIARREARDAMHNWRNGVPEGKLDESRKEQIELTKEEIRRTKHGVKLEQYVNLDADFSNQRSAFGRFLFNRRRDITRAELRQLIHLVYCVYYYQTDALQEAEKPAYIPAATSSEEPETWPPLPVEFQQQLRDCQVAVNSLYCTLKRVEPYINNSGASAPGSTPELCAKYKDWTWYHIQAGFEELGFLPKNSSKSAFANFIHGVFSHRTVESVQRSTYRNSNTNSPNIVADVVKEFKPVLVLFKPLATTNKQ